MHFMSLSMSKKQQQMMLRNTAFMIKVSKVQHCRWAWSYDLKRL